jgi:hypothetical protein
MIYAQLNEDTADSSNSADYADSSNSVDSAPSEDNIAESVSDKLSIRKRDRNRCFSNNDCKHGIFPRPRYCTRSGYCRYRGK